jgi:hypothetical protein
MFASRLRDTLTLQTRLCLGLDPRQAAYADVQHPRVEIGTGGPDRPGKLPTRVRAGDGATHDARRRQASSASARCADRAHLNQVERERHHVTGWRGKRRGAPK